MTETTLCTFWLQSGALWNVGLVHSWFVWQLYYFHCCVLDIILSIETQIVFWINIDRHDINSFWPSNVIWRHRSGSTLVQVMACCRHQCWLFISEGQRHAPGRNFKRDVPIINRWNEHENHLTKTLLKSPRGQWVNRNWFWCIILSILVRSNGICGQTDIVGNSIYVPEYHCRHCNPF